MEELDVVLAFEDPESEVFDDVDEDESVLDDESELFEDELSEDDSEEEDVSEPFEDDAEVDFFPERLSFL